jgi:hypothetical protein
MQSDTWKCYNWFSGKSEQRLLSWRQYRNSLTENYLENVAQLWATCPLVNIHLEQDDTRHWPDPWSLVSEGVYCDVAKCLGMYYTLYFSSYPFRDSMTIECYKDVTKHEYLNLLRCEGQLYTLNYDIGRVVNTPTISSTAVLINSVTNKNLPIRREKSR